jgi:PAS domain S-box-containing protein
MSEPISLKDMKILLVDDTPVNIDVLSKSLMNEGYNIFAAPSGDMALKIVEKIGPDLILLDVMMPGLDGFETCQRLKSKESTKDIPIIFITARADKSDVVNGFQLGGVDYITKPFNYEEVLRRVETHLKIRKLMMNQKDLNNKLTDLNDELVEGRNHYQVISEKTSDGIFKLDQEKKVISCNSKFSSILGYQEREIVGVPIEKLVNVPTPEIIMPQLTTKRFGDRATHNLEVQFCVNEQSSIWKERKFYTLSVDSFGIWNMPNNLLIQKNKDKKFLGTLCFIKKPTN